MVTVAGRVRLRVYRARVYKCDFSLLGRFAERADEGKSWKMGRRKRREAERAALMETGYFKTAWNDIKRSEGWLGKMFMLGLLSMIPIFGQVVLLGYVYGWMRDIAWGVETPLPARIFGNEDGQLYRRGLIVLAINVVFCMVIPWAIEGCFSVMAGRGLDTVSGAAFGSAGHMLSGNVSGLFSLLIAVIASVFYLVAATRASIYGRLGPGFQLSRLWKMMRHDPKGLARVVCVGVVLTACTCAIAGLFAACVGVSVAVLATLGFLGSGGMANALAVMMFVLVVMIIGLVVLVVVLAASAFTSVMTVRAMGYWVRQFDVPAWRGQDDPMPFEVASNQTQR